MTLHHPGAGRTSPAFAGLTTPVLPRPDRVDFDPRYDRTKPIDCEMCGSEMKYIAACKILCTNCGYRRDCSDP
jgi:hypothetical protein